MISWWTKAAAFCAALVAFASADDAHAEYVENQMGRSDAAITMGTAGTVAVVFDVINVVYLAGGSGDQAGRIVTGGGSVLGAGGLIVGSSIALLVVGEEHIPGGAANEDSEEADALTEARVLAGINIGLAAVSLGLGIAALATFDSAADEPAAAGARWVLQPMAFAGGGAGDGVLGGF